jgi:hypothetical protein
LKHFLVYEVVLVDEQDHILDRFIEFHLEERPLLEAISRGCIENGFIVIPEVVNQDLQGEDLLGASPVFFRTMAVARA